MVTHLIDIINAAFTSVSMVTLVWQYGCYVITFIDGARNIQTMSQEGDAQAKGHSHSILQAEVNMLIRFPATAHSKYGPRTEVRKSLCFPDPLPISAYT
jgi:hypothetical protein